MTPYEKDEMSSLSDDSSMGRQQAFEDALHKLREQAQVAMGALTREVQEHPLRTLAVVGAVGNEDRPVALTDLREVIEPRPHECVSRQKRIVVLRDGGERGEGEDQHERAVVVSRREFDRRAAAERLAHQHNAVRRNLRGVG